MYPIIIDGFYSIYTYNNLIGGEAFLTAKYIQNRLSTKALENAPPYELWHGYKPNLSHLKVFSCIAYVHHPKETRQKSQLEYKSIECWFLGYEDGTKGYRLQDKSSKCILIYKDVIFQESKLQTILKPLLAKLKYNKDHELQLAPNFFR